MSESPLSIQMLHDRVMIKTVGGAGERTSRGGILIPATAEVAKRLVWGEVAGVGQHVRSVKLGDRVLFSPDDPYEVEVSGETYLVLRERDLHAVGTDRGGRRDRTVPVATSVATRSNRWWPAAELRTRSSEPGRMREDEAGPDVTVVVPPIARENPRLRESVMNHYDMLVIGSGPAGQKAAIAAAKLGKRAAVVERKEMVGGVCINTGTIPSKTMREAVLYLTGMNQRELYGQAYRVKDEITVADLSARTQHVIGREIDVIRNQLSRNRVALIPGTAAFVDPHTVEINDERGMRQLASADNIVIAVGTKPARPTTVDFDGETIVDSDQILDMDRVPSSMVVVGAGVIGIEYASMFAALGTKVTVVEKRARMLEFCDLEIVEALKYQLRDLAVTFRFCETVHEVKKHNGGTLTILDSGKKIPADTVMYSAGRQGVTDTMNLDAAGLTAANRGLLEVDTEFRTSVPHIYAVGDVIGFPALAATAMEQGRRASYHAFGEPVGGPMTDLQPIGIYTIPELSFVGQTEDELTAE